MHGDRPLPTPTHFHPVVGYRTGVHGTDLALAVLAIATAAVAGATVGRRVAVPYPVFLVLIGLGIGVFARSSEFRLDPDVVFLVFLPPLVFGAGLTSSPTRLAEQKRAIGLLAVGLVAVTALAVALVAHALLGLGAAAALVLGAAVAPTDPIAAVTVMRRSEVRPALSVIVEGEGLLNDGIALVLFSVAVDVALAGHLDPAKVATRVVVGIPGGIAIGLAAAWLALQVLPRVSDGPAEIAMTVITPFLAYLPADRVGASGVLAALAAGLWLGERAPDLHFARVRLQARAFWEVLDFLLNVALFTLLGLSFPTIVRTAPHTTARLVVAAAAISAAVIVVRMAWMFLVPALLGLAGRRSQASRRERVVLGWAGMRGAVSLAAALAVPVGIGAPGTTSVIAFVVIGVIVATLLVQGSSLPILLRVLRIGGHEPRDEIERDARLALERAAVSRLDRLHEERERWPAAVDRLRARHLARCEELRNGADAEDGDTMAVEREAEREVVQAQREALRELRRSRRLDPDTFRTLERELDLREARLR
jgi:Na+/H+ antiporter